MQLLNWAAGGERGIGKGRGRGGGDGVGGGRKGVGLEYRL